VHVIIIRLKRSRKLQNRPLRHLQSYFHATRQRIFSVIVEDNLIKNGLGHPLGTLYNAIYTYGQDEKCQLGAEDMSGKVLCYAPQYPNILYVFNANTTEIVSAIPPADVLQGWALESIIWRPKS